ncbi:LysE family translocator [Mycolicibacterium mageritense]
MALFTIASAIAFGAISPGPSFVMVAQTSLSTTRRNGTLAALGIGAGALIFSLTATVGLSAVITYAGSVFQAIKILGGAYLLYLGFRLWRASTRNRFETNVRRLPATRTFVTAMLTQLSNPKAIVVYGSVFASALPPHPASWLLFALPLSVTGVESLWYVLVATVMSRPAPRRLYSRSARALDRCAATIMGGLGAFFAGDGLRTATS